MLRPLSVYTRLLHQQPLRTKATTSAFISGVGDCTCQVLIEKREVPEMRRLAIFAALGGFLVGPMLHTWYSALYRIVPGTSPASIAQRLVLDQLFFAPAFIPLFLTSLLMLEGAETPLRQTQATWWPTVLANWKLWIPAQLVNFAVVPPHFQVLFANGVAVAWNTYISYATHSSQPLEPSPKADNRKLERGGRGRREDDKSVSTA